VGRLILAILLTAALAACQTAPHAVLTATPTSSPSPTPHVTATAAILQPSEAPADLNVCLGSGPVDVYLTSLTQADATVGARASNQWRQLQSQGARNGAISLFAANASACSVELGATSTVRAVVSFVARFDDSGQAHRAWETGVFGFAPPPPGQIAAGVTRGTATGLGLSSFTYDRPSVRLASWHRSVFVSLVVVSNLDSNTFKSAATAIDARLD
jgi:hypothetical protein